MSKETSIRAMEQLGFTRVEAEVYVHLVHNSPATGYQIAKAIDRTGGAAYKVLASLASKGAIEVQSGKARLWRAVPPEELLEQMEARFRKGRERAGKELMKLEPAPPDYRIYQLQSVGQVYERARRMIATCTKTAYMDMYPDPIGNLGKELRSAVRRGIRLTMLVYEPVRLPGALVIATCKDHPAPDRFPITWLALSTDGRECLIAAISRDGESLLEAFWAASPFFAWVHSSYMMMSILAENIGALVEEGGTLKDIKRSYNTFFKHNVPYSAPGFADLLKRFSLEEA
jgi:sugar-specific transcriptional regulator TrmB